MTAQKPAGSRIGISWAEASANIAAVQAALRRPPTEEPTMTLTDFLLARIAEDEASVRREWNADGVTDERFWGTPLQPSRVLDECEAKRRIVEMHAMDRREPDLCATCPSHSDLYLCRTSRALAAVYSDHADYDEAWRP